MSHGGRAVVVVTLFVLCCLWATPAFAYDERPGGSTSWGPPYDDSLVRITCWSCHGPEYGAGVPLPQGPHVGYLTTTNKCAQCHVLHDAPSGLLLAGETITDTCNMCHDGTGGNGVYNVISARVPAVPVPPALHRTEVTRSIPGGDPVGGGSVDGTFNGLNQAMTCSDCHSPHGQNMVTAYTGDRWRARASYVPPTSTKLLKQKPGGSAVAVTKYGSDWCLACHEGRASGLAATHNHPVERGTTIVYDSLPILNGVGPTSATVIGGLGQSNRGYLMPFPRTAQQAGIDPICQQCHEDARNVGTLSDAGVATAASFILTQKDGRAAADNPRFQTFPHEGLNDGFLVEEYDNLCINCHSQAQID